MTERVTLERRGTTALITINRPETLNALDMPTLAELDQRVSEAERDDAIRVIVFTGAGERAFVAGGDIADLNSRQGLTHYLELAERLHEVFRHIERLDKPTIAAVNGWALGGGVEYAFARNVSLKAEYLYYDLAKADYAVAAANTIAEGEGLFVNASQRLDGSLVRIGLNVRY